MADPVTRAEVVNGILSLFSEPRYLEVGVEKGITFFAAKAAAKVAVDPYFSFTPETREGEGAANAAFFEVTSDRYFGEFASKHERFDVIFLDGLHTLEQTLRDLLNAVEFLKPNGVIIVDDVRPDSYHSSLPDRSTTYRVKEVYDPLSANWNWMGDVYRLVFFIRSFLQQYSYATVSNNHGQTILWRQARPEVTQRSVEGIGRLPFEAIVREQDAFNYAPFVDILEALRRRPAGGLG